MSKLEFLGFVSCVIATLATILISPFLGLIFAGCGIYCFVKGSS